MPKIEIVSIKPRVTEEEQIVIDVEAALYQEKDGDQDSGMRVPNITFEVRTLVANVTGISSEKGYFTKTDILINTCEGEEQRTTTEKLTITANYTEQDESRKAIEEITVDISDQLASIHEIKRARKEKEAKILAKEAEALRAKEVEAERRRLNQEIYERLDPDRKRQIKADITKAGEDIKNRERLQVSPFNVLREYADHPHAERTAIMVAAEAAERTIEAVEIYKSATWASKVMKIATEKQPLMAIKTIARYKDMDWAPEILKIAAQRHPHEVVKALSQYCEFEWCKDMILHIAATEPQAAFEEVEMWEFYPWAEEAAMTAANKAPEFTVNNFVLYQDQPWAQRVYESVAISGEITGAEKAEVQRLLKKKITEAGTRLLKKTVNNEDFAIVYEHRLHPHSKVMITNVAEKNPDACIKAVRVYKSAQWAKEIMLLATEKATITAINEIDEYIEMEWTEDIMKKAASLKPKEALRALPKYAGYTWSRSVVESIAISSPDSIFEEMEFIEYQPWAEEVVDKAASGNPKKALTLQSGYENQPWAPAILKGIEDRKQKEQALVRQRAEEARRQEQQEQVEREALQVGGRQGSLQLAKPASRPIVRKSDGEIQRERLEEERKARLAEEAAESKATRRKFLFAMMGLPVAAFGGYHAYKWWKSPDYKKLLEGINMEDIEADPAEILPEDIDTILTDENLRYVFGDFPIRVLFDKNKDGSYKFNFPQDTSRKLERIISPFLSFSMNGLGNLHPTTIISDGIFTMNFRFTPFHSVKRHYTTGWIFKDHHYENEIVPDNDNAIDIPDWFTVKVDRIAIDDNAVKVTITTKQIPMRSISESVKFVLDRGDISNVVHHAEIQYGYISTHKSKVIHSPEGQAAIREERRKRTVRKRIGK